MSELTMEMIEEQIQNAPFSREEARQQFIEKTAFLDLKHAFTFDEAWDFLEYKKKQTEFREKITRFEEAVNQHPESSKDEDHKINPLKHSFADGQYIREIFNPAGLFIVTKIHNKTHPFFLMEGEMSIYTEEGVERIKAPHHAITKVGAKRIIFTHTPCRFITVHATDKLNIEEIEEEIIAKSFEELKLTVPDTKQIDRLIGQIQEKSQCR
tara:strand:- start:3839 stop:4471 length:633 start_codon:yes stop_codon:yes gene_type:complete